MESKKVTSYTQRYKIRTNLNIHPRSIKMTTSIDTLIDEEYVSGSDSDCDNLPEVVMDLSRSVDKRINALEKYYIKEGDNAMELLSTLVGMYQMSGSKLIEHFFYRICTHGQVSSFLKLEAAKNLLDYEELQEGSDSDEDEDEKKGRIARDEQVRKNNADRKVLGFKALDYVCYDLNSIPTPCRIEAICRLMESTDFQTNTEAYFREFVRDENIDCDFRYKTILSLEKIGADLMKEEIGELFSEREFVVHLYESLEPVITKLFPKIKPMNLPKNKQLRFWNEMIFHLSYDDIREVYKEKFPEKPCGCDFFIREAQLAFLFHNPNMTCYRILCGQYLLQKCELTETKRFQVEKQVLEFAKDEELDYNCRADAADVLLRLGSDGMKQHGRDVIMELGKVDGEIRTVFDNAQNVHTEKVEESVTEALGFLSALPLYKVKKKPIEFNYVNEQVEKMLKDERKSLMILEDGKENCDHCESHIEDKVEDGDKKFCSDECLHFYFRDEKIRVAMNRIYMDRALYSKFNSSLANILLKVYTYIVTHEEESIQQQMYKRLLEELEEMSGTCSSGFATRLINVISGFGQFNIRISYEDQIVANFTGRLNAAARQITESDSIFRGKRVKDVVELWLNRAENIGERDKIENKLNPSGKPEKYPKTDDVVDEFLSENQEDRVEQCVQDFAEAVLNEMVTASSNYAARQNFTLFFRSYVSVIREELASEFKDLVTSTDFDLYFRKALMVYEGEF